LIRGGNAGERAITSINRLRRMAYQGTSRASRRRLSLFGSHLTVSSGLIRKAASGGEKEADKRKRKLYEKKIIGKSQAENRL